MALHRELGPLNVFTSKIPCSSHGAKKAPANINCTSGTFVKADLKKYKNYTILFNAREIENGLFSPVATLFKSGETSITLEIDRSFKNRDEALSFALGAAEDAVDAKIKGNKPDFGLLVGEG